MAKKKSNKNLGIAAGVGLGLGLLYLVSRGNDEIKLEYAPTEVEASPLYSRPSQSEVQEIAQTITEEYSADVMEAQIALTKEEASKVEQFAKIQDLRSQIALQESILAENEKTNDGYQLTLDQMKNVLDTTFAVEEATLLGTYNAITNEINGINAEIILLERELAEQNAWLASLSWLAWLEKDKTEVRIAQIETDLGLLYAKRTRKEIDQSNAYALLEQKRNEIRKYIVQRDGIAQQKVLFMQQSITPVKAQIQALNQTLQSYIISYNVTFETIIQLKNMLGLPLSEDEIKFIGGS